MRAMLGASQAPHHVSALRRGLQVVESLLQGLTPANPLAWLHARIVATRAARLTATDAIAEEMPRPGLGANPSVTPPDVPAPHLFLLDMKIGR